MTDSTTLAKTKLYLVTFDFYPPNESNELVYALLCMGSVYGVNRNACILETSHNLSVLALWTFLKNSFQDDDDTLQIFRVNKTCIYPKFNEDNYPSDEDLYLTDKESKSVESKVKKFIENLK